MVSRSFILFKISFVFIIGTLSAQEHIFTNYSLQEGLPQSSIISIFQDKTGNMWFGTQGGVSKFNGNGFVNYDTRHGLADNHITAIFQDSRGRYWFGHRYKGLSTMHGNSFRNYEFTNQQITKIYEDKFSNMWFATLTNGLYFLFPNGDEIHPNFLRLDMYSDFPQTDVLDILEGPGDDILAATWMGLCLIKTSDTLDDISVRQFNKEKNGLPFNEILSIARESDRIYWLMGFEGISKIEIGNDDGIKILGYYKFGNKIRTSSANNIIIDESHTIWGTSVTGIYKFRDGKFTRNFRGTGYKETKTYSVFEDKEKNIWIGTMDQGAFKFSNDKFILFDESTGLLNNTVTSVIKDHKGRLWIATEKGICVYDGDNYTYYRNEDIHLKTSVNVLFEDSKGNIWIGNMSKEPLLRYDPEKGSFRYFDLNGKIPTTSVLTINEDPEGNIWFASLWDSPFRYTYPKNGEPGKFKSFSRADGLCSNSIWIIHRDIRGNLWFGSDDAGLSMYDGNKFTTYNQHDGLTNLSPGALTSDSRNNLWIASIGGGIYKFDGKRFTNYSISDGLSSDSPFSIICDDNDIVWIGTNSGLDKFDPVYETFRHYDKDEGFVGIENNQNAVCKDKNGIIYFGTIRGLVKFDPALDRPNKIPPVSIIENIKLYYNDFDYSAYSKSIDQATNLPVGMELNYKNNHLTFEYVGVSHIAPDKIKYRYQLENFDENWNPVTKSTVATYTNIPPGEYTFKIVAANSDDAWDPTPATFSFTILPPIWQTAWFRVLAILFLAGIIYLFIWWRLRSINLQKMKLENEVNKKTRELQEEAEERKKAQIQAEQADKLKTAFLANMSHEIRTPVNSIIGFADLLKETDLDEKDKRVYLEYIRTGGNTLLTLINDIIDISKIEAGQIRIAEEIADLGNLMSELFITFYEQLKKKDKQHVELKIPEGLLETSLNIYTDPHRLKQIMSNLIGNAIKFTDAGFIEFGYDFESPGSIRFFVKDTGIGIPEDKQEIIFQRFRQVEETFTRNYDGTGLGLSISKKLTDLMDGEMWVESKQGDGSIFYFTIPYKPVDQNARIFVPESIDPDKELLYNKTVLVVEDEQSNFLLIEKILNNWNIKLIHVMDGNDAVETFKNRQSEIDLVLMDIKVPGMNGYEVTKVIKKINESIPVIAQTAYAMTDERAQCVKAGCDDYISKPYNREQLIRIIHKNLVIRNAVVENHTN